MDILEDRTVPSAQLLGFSALTGDWLTGTVDGDQLQTALSAHWDPYNLTAVVSGDFNGDGITDVAGWNRRGYWLVGLGDGSGHFQTEQWSDGFGRGWGWGTFLTGDFDGDGKDDIAMFAKNGGWWVARSTGTSFEIESWGQTGDWLTGGPWRDWEVGDFNGDGKADVAGLTAQRGWQVGLSTGTAFTEQTWLGAGSWLRGSRVQAVVAGDFNGDGKTDLAGFMANHLALVALSDGMGFDSTVWATGHRVGKASRLYRAGDVDGDGKADVFALDHWGHLETFASTGSSFATPAIDAYPRNFGRPVDLIVGDFRDEGDGKNEVAILTRHGRWLLGESAGVHTAFSSPGTFGAGRWVAAFATGVNRGDPRVNHHSSIRVRSYLNFITRQDLGRLRADPSYFGTIFNSYQYFLRNLAEPVYGDLNDQGVAICLATIVAYEVAPYRGLSDPEGTFRRPRSLSLGDLLHTRKLVCDEYCYLAVELYHIVFPASSDPDTVLHIIGFRSGPFGNHAQLTFANSGFSLLTDPTLGLVARTTIASLQQGKHVANSAIRQWIHRAESTYFMRATMSNFRALVVNALRRGLYRYARLMYDIDARFID
jgi:hypothetical protein